MKKIYLVLGMVAFGFANVNAQDGSDTNTAAHDVTMAVSEVALIDINEAGDEATTTAFDMATFQSGIEAGTYDFSEIVPLTFYLNYTSVVSAAAFGSADAERTITAELSTANLPSIVDLVITPGAFNLVPGGSGAGSQGTASGALAFNNTLVAAQDIVQNVESVYTGDAAVDPTAGLELEYSLVQRAGTTFDQYEAGSYNATVLYTISDL